MNNFFSKKRILVAGGTGLVGQQLVDKLLRYGAKVIVAWFKQSWKLQTSYEKGWYCF